MVLAALTAIATLVGALTMAVGAILSGWYIYTRRPTPARSLREAVGELRWGFGIAVFVIPQGLVGYDEGLGFLGFYLGFGFLGLLLLAAWWWEI